MYRATKYMLHNLLFKLTAKDIISILFLKTTATFEIVFVLQGDGIFCPGGSIANMYGMVLARHARFPHIKSTGTIHGFGQ
jgi:hypothetical protein